MQIKEHKTALASACGAVVEGLENRRLLSTYTVSNTNDSGAGSLRQAILDANQHGGHDTIKFAIGSGAKTINLSSKLPAISQATTLDATTQPGFAGKPIIEINGANAGSNADGIKLTGSGITVRGLVINRFGGSGIFIYGAGGNRIAGNYIGTDRAGSAAAGNKAHGIIVQSPNNVIGGTSSADRNVISGNSIGVFLYTSAATKNVVRGNFIGTDATGTKKLGNTNNGVQCESAPGNVIGGIGAAHRNVISGNGRDGVLIVNSGSKLNAVQGNFIGTDVSGTKALGNGWYGVEVSRQDNVIGGSALGAGNVVSANGKGGIVLFLASASGNRVQGNYVGTDVTGTKDLGNVGRGIEFTNGAHDNLVGGDRFSQRNVISGNNGGGVGIYSGSKYNYLLGNLIGLTQSGAGMLGNGYAGVIVTDNAGLNFIGAARAGNIIAANNQGIVLTSGCDATLVQGNYIGTDVTGTRDFGNATDGIYVGSSRNQIGGRKRGTGNLISGNNGDGVRVNNSVGNLIRRNIIGASATAQSLRNVGNGVLLMNTKDTPVRGNIIAHNGGDGVKVSGGSNNSVVLNSIYSNSGLPLRGGSSTTTATVKSIKLTNGKHTISGSVTAKANSSIYVELFLNNKIVLSTFTVKTNGSGNADFALTTSALAAGSSVTATATGADGATSPFSAARTV